MKLLGADFKLVSFGKPERKHAKVFDQRLPVNPDFQMAGELVKREVDLVLLLYANAKAELHTDLAYRSGSLWSKPITESSESRPAGFSSPNPPQQPGHRNDHHGPQPLPIVCDELLGSIPAIYVNDDRLLKGLVIGGLFTPSL